MKIELKPNGRANETEYYVKIKITGCRSPDYFGLDNLSLDQIEDLEINLTDIIKQLQDYRLAQIGGDENDIQINQHEVDIDRCQHENDPFLHPVVGPVPTEYLYKCIKCGEYYR